MSAIPDAEFAVLVVRNSKEQVEQCPAQTLNDAKLHAQGLVKRDQDIQRVTVLERATHAPLGSVSADDHEWRPAANFPVRRMTWH